MNKKIVMLCLCAMIIALSCKFLRKSEPVRENENELASNLLVANVPGSSTQPISPTPVDDQPSTPPILPTPPKPVSPPNTADAKPIITQYDSEKLDREVREEALKMGKDPATYRKIVRIEPDGTKIYRQIGMHIIVSSNNEEVFLPDEI